MHVSPSSPDLPSPRATPDPDRPIRRLQSALASEVAGERLDWLWPGWLAFGKLAVLEGDPGLGKSTLALDLAARLSRGAAMPGESSGNPRQPAAALIASAEDSASKDIRPRLEAAGADLSRVRIIDGVVQGDLLRALLLPDDLSLLEARMREDGTRLVIIDPLMAFLGRDGRGQAIDSHKDQSVRRLLGKLTWLAEATGAVVLLVRHLTKKEGVRAIHRGYGSVGIGGAARCVLLVARHPQDPGRRVLAVTKTNLGPRPASRTFRLTEGPSSTGPAARLEWLGEEDLSCDHLLQPATRTPDTVLDAAMNFLLKTLRDGPLPQRQLQDDAEAAGISLTTLVRAKKELGIHSEKYGRHGQWYWRLCEPGELPPLD
jgi:archaellum biogenesis ATPase FlaH